MSYTPINTNAYIAAFSGALAGMGVTDWVNNPNQSNYATVSAVAGAFAEAFDVAWNDATALNLYEQECIEQACEAEFIKHAPILSQTAMQLRASWTVPAQAIVALVLRGGVYLASQGILPPSTGGVSPLSSVFFVDAGSTGTSPDGSIGNPFTTIQDAFDAIPLASTAFTLMLTPGSYGNLTLPPTYNKQLSVIGMTGTEQNNAGPIVNIATITLDTGSGAAALTFQNVYIDTVASTPASTATPGASVMFSQCYIATAFDCQWTSLLMNNCGFALQSPAVLTAIDAEFYDCKGGGQPFGMSFTSVRWDEATERNFAQTGGFIPLGTGTDLHVRGSDPDALTGTDVAVTQTGPGRLIYWKNKITGTTTVTVDAGGDPSTIIVDVYPQTHDVVIHDNFSTTDIFTVTNGSGATRLYVFGDGTGAMAIVGRELLGTGA